MKSGKSHKSERDSDQRHEGRAKSAEGTKAHGKSTRGKSDAKKAKGTGQTDKAEAAETTQPVDEALETRYLRLRADFENFRKRVLREKNELYRRANEDLLEELLPVLDHLELAVDAAATHDADDAFLEGFRLVSEQMLAALRKFGVSPVDAEGEPFDHNRHEAISHLPSTDVAEGCVVAQTRRGYMLGDHLLRAAQVVVSSGPGPAGQTETGKKQVEVEG